MNKQRFPTESATSVKDFTYVFLDLKFLIVAKKSVL